jgi:hypothetical protein
MSAFRVYAAAECGPDNYPLAWHSIDGGPGVKHLVREQAGHRCVRCQHPYAQGAGEWSPCDEHCTHQGPGRYRPGWSDLGENTGETSDIDPWSGLTATPADATAGDLIDGGIDVEARWRVLTVHHLVSGDEAKRDLRWWNLAALCQRCHLTIQGRVQMERVYPWPHSEWFKPYAAAWYAWTYLGEDLTRAETMARLDELLALELAGGHR